MYHCVKKTKDSSLVAICAVVTRKHWPPAQTRRPRSPLIGRDGYVFVKRSAYMTACLVCSPESSGVCWIETGLSQG